MKQDILNILRPSKAFMLLVAMLVSTVAAMAQVTQVHGTVSDDFGPLMGAAICEIDGNGRIVESTVTDMNGNFTMKVRNSAKNKLRISYVGLKTQTLKFDKTTFDVMMASATTLQEVTVKSKKRLTGNNLPIPENEVSFAKQGISAKDFEGLGISSIDEALQGRIAGLDIVGASGNIGSGSVMRLRGSASLSAGVDQNPLIVVDGNVRDVDMSAFDSNSSDMNEQMAMLLNINTEDIESLNVLLDGAGAAIYGSQGANGVIEITTKRGSRGKPKVTYSLKLTGKYQPKGLKLLNGDEYTMLLKEEYFNPTQNDQASSNVNEINYITDGSFADWRNYSVNTDWRDAVTQVGLLQNHYITMEGGGEKATFRISGGFDKEKGAVIGQAMNRFSTRVNLDYQVSSRIRVQTNFSMMYTKYDRNSDDLISIAEKKMPNMSIYQIDANGNPTDQYFDMPQSGYYIGNNIFENDQRKQSYVNPVASGNLAKWANTQYDLTPELVLNYELLGMDEDHHRLKYRGAVYMNIFNDYVDKFYPSELVSTTWRGGQNTSYERSYKKVSFTTKHELQFIPSLKNKDHSVMALARMELNTGSSSSQTTNGTGLPNGGVESPNLGGLLVAGSPLQSDFGDWRGLYFTMTAHYSYKNRYVVDGTIRIDGTTKLGPDQHWLYNPAASLRWNVIEEPFLKNLKESGIVSMLSVRPSWSLLNQPPGGNFLYISKYNTQGGTYLGMAAMNPSNLRLNNLQCEKNNKLNLGFDLGLLNDKIVLAFEIYNNTRTNMLMGNYRIPSSTGFTTIGSYNTGKMRSTGWSFRINANNFVKKGKFSADAYVNFSNDRSTLLEMEPTLLKNMNTTVDMTKNAQVLSRVVVDNPLNGIYGYVSKGVYMYQYETIKNMPKDQQQAFINAGNTAPVALNAQGEIIRDANGDPIQMRYAYTNDNTGVNDPDGTAGYRFKGGDAIYEDINHDGQINALDIKYLGSSLPKFYGGFGFTLKYGAWRLSTNFSYRVGVDIINRKRLNSEAMVNNDNQSQAVNYRWRKEGDVTSIPRAMYGANTNFNTLMSDRFVESGSYVRLGFVQLNYTLNKKQLKWIGLNKISLYASAHNLLVLTNYTGVDPDVSARGYNPAVDDAQTPQPRTFTFGMTVDF